MPSRSTKFYDLSSLVRAHCWGEGYAASEEWVHRLLDLELAAWARRNGTSLAQAESDMPFDHAVEMGGMLVSITRELS